MSAIGRHWDAVRDALAREKNRTTARLSVSEAAFLPAAMEIVERPVSPTARITSWVLLIVLVLTIAWLVLGRVDVVVSATGKLVPADNIKLVQPSEPGIVRAIRVRDGQRVTAGQVLIELDPTVSAAEAIQAEKALEKAALDASRLRAMLGVLDGRGFVFRPPAGTPSAVATVQADLARAQLADIAANAATHRADRSAASATQAEAAAMVAKLDETLPLLDEQIAANERLLAKGFVSKLKVLEMRRQRLAAARDRDAALAIARKAHAQSAVADGGMARSAAETRARLLTELVQAESEARLRREELTKATRRSSLQRLRSPVDGTIAQLAVHTIGGVVEAAKPVMVVVPSGSRLVADVRVLNKDVGFLRPGQAVAMKIEAFPFTRYGTIPGRLIHIGSDAIEDERIGLVYPARVALDRGTIGRDGQTIALSPGLAVTADIRTGTRTIASYLLGPIDAARLEAGRER